MKAKYILLSFLGFACGSNLEIPLGTFELVRGETDKAFVVFCIPLVKAESPFRIRFVESSLVELYPAIMQTAMNSPDYKLLGYQGRFIFQKNTLIIVPIQPNSDSVTYRLLSSSEDSLVLQTLEGHTETYIRRKFHDEAKPVDTFWKIEIESFPSFSTCSPYKLVVDSTGFLSVSTRYSELKCELTNDETRALFARINMHSYSLNEERNEESDSRVVRFMAWGSKGVMTLESDPVYFCYELKRLLITFDDFVYNYSEKKRLVVY